MRRFGAVVIGAVPVTVILAKPEETDGEMSPDEEGVTAPEHSAVYLNENRAKNDMRMAAVAAHEIVHALLEGSGVQAKLRTVVPDEEYEDFEEDLVNMLTPSFMTACKDFPIVAMEIRRFFESKE